MSTPEESDGSRMAPGEASPLVPVDTVSADGKPVAEWSYAEWEAYRLRGENEELRRQREQAESPAEAHRHALRWAVVAGSTGAEFALAMTLSGTLSVVFWVIFAAQVLGMIAYGLSMSQYREREQHKRTS
jgi:hypothetical protein